MLLVEAGPFLAAMAAPVLRFSSSTVAAGVLELSAVVTDELCSMRCVLVVGLHLESIFLVAASLRFRMSSEEAFNGAGKQKSRWPLHDG